MKTLKFVRRCASHLTMLTKFPYLTVNLNASPNGMNKSPSKTLVTSCWRYRPCRWSSASQNIKSNTRSWSLPPPLCFCAEHLTFNCSEGSVSVTSSRFWWIRESTEQQMSPDSRLLIDVPPTFDLQSQKKKKSPLAWWNCVGIVFTGGGCYIVCWSDLSSGLITMRLVVQVPQGAINTVALSKALKPRSRWERIVLLLWMKLGHITTIEMHFFLKMYTKLRYSFLKLTT